MTIDPVDFEDGPALIAPTAAATKAERNKVNGVHALPAKELERTREFTRGLATASAAPGRTLPHSLEAEEFLLSCCLMDGPSVLPKCTEARITPDSFYETKHGVIYDCLQSLSARGLPTEIHNVAEELKTTRQLDLVGGYAFLVQVSAAQPTTAQAPYFIEKVRAYSQRRELIRRSIIIVEQAYDLSVELPELDRPTRSVLKSFRDFALPSDGDSSVLLGNRYLCRGDGAVLSGTSGIGKSSLSLLLAILWALGRPAFGIKPNGPLSSLIIQSEDSEGDMAEVWASIIHCLDLTPAEQEQVHARVHVVTDRVNRGLTFHKALKDLTTAQTYDLVWINPLQAFVDGDITKSQDLGAFLRGSLNSLNEPVRFAYILIHHTTKPATGKDRADRLWHEVMYDMAGGAELINWARAILSLRPAADEGNFNLVLAKRGRRAGVTKEVPQGVGFREEIVTTISLKHAIGTIPIPNRAKPMPLVFWESREPDAPPPKEAKGGRPEKYAYADYRTLMPSKKERGLEIGLLNRRLDANGAIPKKILHNVLKRWAENGDIEIISEHGSPNRYRAAD